MRFLDGSSRSQSRTGAVAKEAVSCAVNATVKLLGSVTAIVDNLITRVGLTSVVSGLLTQLQPQRAAYGAAITTDVTAIKSVTVYGTAGVVAGTFRDLQAR